MRTLALMLSLVAAISIAAAAQETTGTITGTASDQTGAVLPGVNVTSKPYLSIHAAPIPGFRLIRPNSGTLSPYLAFAQLPVIRLLIYRVTNPADEGVTEPISHKPDFHTHSSSRDRNTG